MNIQPIKSDAPALSVKSRAAAPNPPVSADVQPDPVMVERKRQLLEKLGRQESARPEEVARAEAIVADTTYPSNELMGRLAKLLTGVR